MLLTVALLPPPETLDRLRLVAASVAPVEASGTGPDRSRSGWLRRRQAPTSVMTGPMLDLLPVAAMHLTLAKLGNLSAGDADQFAAALGAAAARWDPPEMALVGALAPEPGDDSVWLRIGGDLAGLESIMRGVDQVARRRHHYIDRRAFRPVLRLGRTNHATTTEYLSRLVSTLDSYRGTTWRQDHIALLSDTGSGRSETVKIFRELPLG